MAINDPAGRNLLRLEARRFASRCESQVALVERADTLREVSRLATSMTLPYALGEEYSARDALRLLQTRAEDRARELIQDQVQGFLHAEMNQHDKLKRGMLDAWANLTGPLGHLRPWAMSKLAAAEQSLQTSGISPGIPPG